MRRRNAPSNSPASLLRRFGSRTVARFVLISHCPAFRTSSLSRPFSSALLYFIPIAVGVFPCLWPSSWKRTILFPAGTSGCQGNKQTAGHAAYRLFYIRNSCVCQALPSTHWKLERWKPHPLTSHAKYFAPSRKETCISPAHVATDAFVRRASCGDGRLRLSREGEAE